MTEISLEKGTAIVKPGRDIVASMAESFSKDLKRIMSQDSISRLVMDLSGVDMLDSIGLGLLIATHNTLSERGGGLVITGATEEIQHLLQTMRLDKHFTIQ